MKSYDPTTQAKLDAGELAERDMILFDFGADGLHGFWTGAAVLNYNGVDYIPSGRLFKLNAIGGSADLASIAVTGSISAVPDSALTPDVLASIENYAWHQSPVVISKVYIDLDTRALISVERIYRGYFDKLDHDEQAGGGYTLTPYFESKSRDHMKRGWRVRGDADQRRVKATDGGLRYVAVAGNQEIKWGQIVTTAAASSLPSTIAAAVT
jgi:hypothetical protein